MRKFHSRRRGAAALPSPPTQTSTSLPANPNGARLASEIGGDKVSVYTATTGPQDPHQVQARPSLIAKARGGRYYCLHRRRTRDRLAADGRAAIGEREYHGRCRRFVRSGKFCPACSKCPAQFDRARRRHSSRRQSAYSNRSAQHSDRGQAARRTALRNSMRRMRRPTTALCRLRGALDRGHRQMGRRRPRR